MYVCLAATRWNCVEYHWIVNSYSVVCANLCKQFQSKAVMKKYSRYFILSLTPYSLSVSLCVSFLITKNINTHRTWTNLQRVLIEKNHSLIYFNKKNSASAFVLKVTNTIQYNVKKELEFVLINKKKNVRVFIPENMMFNILLRE